MTVWALIVAAGRGSRAGGDIPKQYQKIEGVSLLQHTSNAIASHSEISGFVYVINPDDRALFDAAVKMPPDLAVCVVSGGATRDASVRAGLAALPDTAQIVMIHDAARPFARAEILDRLLSALQTHPCAAPALPVVDALWKGADGLVCGTQDRSGLYRAQTPQTFRLAEIRAAHAAWPEGESAADDVEVARRFGLDVAIVAGDEDNFKVTHPADFTRAAQTLRQWQAKDKPMDFRTGQGFDVHAFEAGDHVTLCGVKILHSQSLKGHSDADVAMHAVTDAIYGALADGDIGQHFPPSDPQWKGAASEIFLRHAVDLAASRGFTITHTDCTIICERPKIGPHALAMREEMARLMGLDLDRVSVKATTSEKLGFTGREEGIAALATASLVKL
ncbi:MAG: bifunctional 2-C-methyl-D-erythritol 4-phosphate cytidylyltransferase/2-C-methyl-D-erythritol 2,4-cyclodiphosphate synthase [Mangrovicoccus sp.]